MELDKESSPPQLRLTVACGPVPCDTEEGRSFLQERLALFGNIGFWLCVGHFVFSNVLSTITGETGWFQWVGNRYNQLHLVGCAVFAAVYFLSRWGRPSHLTLGLIDTACAVAVGALFGVHCAELSSDDTTRYVALLVVTNMLLCRAVIVPSSAPLTLLVGLLAVIPVIIGSYLSRSSGSEATTLAAWGALPIAISTVTSRILYGLRQEVEEARQFGQYTLDERIGEGGMGEVYKASHSMLRRPTAIKLLRSDLSSDRSLKRFEREVQLTSRLTHPNTVAIYDYGRTPDGVFYYAMEYLDGIDLEQLVQGGGHQSAGRVIHILRQVCSSLIEAHETGLIHRDIKPANIILCERGMMHDVVKVVDFGLVKDVEKPGDATLSSINTITGTPLYLSPEGIRSPEKVDARSDLYALGAVGYFLLTGLPLFDGENFMEICSHHLQTPPIPPSERIGKPIPRDIEGLILMCLEKDPDRRPKDARALRAALDRCEDSGRWKEEDAARWWMHTAPVIRKPDAPATEGTPAPTATAVDSPLDQSAVAAADGHTRRVDNPPRPQ